MATAVLETAEIGVVHQTDVAGLGRLDDDDVVFIQVFALVDEFHVLLRTYGLKSANFITMRGDFRRAVALNERRHHSSELNALAVVNKGLELQETCE